MTLHNCEEQNPRRTMVKRKPSRPEHPVHDFEGRELSWFMVAYFNWSAVMFRPFGQMTWLTWDFYALLEFKDAFSFCRAPRQVSPRQARARSLCTAAIGLAAICLAPKMRPLVGRQELKHQDISTSKAMYTDRFFVNLICNIILHYTFWCTISDIWAKEIFK